MNKEQQIEEIATIISNSCERHGFDLHEPEIDLVAIDVYNAGYRKTFTSDFASDTQKAYKEGYIKGIEERKAETERLKAQLSEFEKTVTQFVKDRETQAVKEFAEKLQKELPCRDYTLNGITFSMILASSMKYVIDKLLKEYKQ